MSKAFFLGIIFLTTFISCKEEKNRNMSIDESHSMQLYKIAAIIDGDESAYGSYLEYADNHGLYYEKLSFSLLMNSRHNSLQSYYQVYRNLIELHNNNKYNAKYLAELDSVNVNFAFYYLLKGAEKSFISCQVALEKTYRNGYGIKKDLIKADSIYQILEKDNGLGRFYQKNKLDKSKVDNIE